MNYRLVARLLGIVSFLIGATMALSLPWAFPFTGAGHTEFEAHGFWALIGSIVVCGVVGLLLRSAGRDADETLFRKEAMAVVGLSWIIATVLRKIVTKTLGATSLDEKISVEAGMQPMSKSVGNVLYGVVILLFLPAVHDNFAEAVILSDYFYM